MKGVEKMIKLCILLLILIIHCYSDNMLSNLIDHTITKDSIYVHQDSENYKWVALQKIDQYVLIALWSSGWVEFAPIMVEISKKNKIQRGDRLPSGKYKFIGTKKFIDHDGFDIYLPVIEVFH